MNIICRLFGHNFRSGWAGAYGGPFGAVVVNMKTCNRCDHTENELSTVITLDSEDSHEPSLHD